jgi:polysaccharide biosynthesis protein PelA
MKPRDRLRLAFLLGLSLACKSGIGSNRSEQKQLPAHPRFVVYYGTADVAGLYQYDVAVLDSDVDQAILRKFSVDSLLLGYLSLGEVHQGRSYADKLTRQGLLLSRNPNWPEGQFVDVRDGRWRQLVIHDLVPAILERGFKGLFFDTLDSPAFLEQSDPVAYRGMTDAAAELVLAIRRAFPNLPIMVNRGYAVLPRIASEIDMVMGESVHSTYDAAKKSYVHVAPENVKWQLDRLNDARRICPSMLLFSLDYWSPGDSGGIARVYAEAETNGLVPYVATFDLSQVVTRP